MLEYAPEVGSVTPEIHEWTEKIIDRTRERTAEYYPTEEPGRTILNSAMTYIVTCDSCGGDVPLVGKWWLNKTSNGGDAVRPHYEDGEVSYEHVKVQNHNDFDPSDAPVSRGGDAECPHCTVTMDSETIREKFAQEEFEYSVYGVNYKDKHGMKGFRAGGEVDRTGIKKAAKRVEEDFEMVDFFSEPIEGGFNQDQIKGYGLTQWRDAFSPRQLVVHYELLDIISMLKDEMKDKLGQKEYELSLSLIAMAVDRQIQHNCRLAQWRDSRGYGSYVFSDNNYSIKRMTVGNNVCEDRRGLERQFEHVIDDSYEHIATYATSIESDRSVYKGDAAELENRISDDSVEVAVVDPPYFDSIMYGELSDFRI